MKNRQALTSLSCALWKGKLAQMKIREILSKHKKTILFFLFYCSGGQSLYPMAQRVIEPPSLEVQKTGMVLGNLRWLPLLEQGDGHQKSCPISVILWFSDCVCQTILQFELSSTLFQILWKMSSSIMTGMGESLKQEKCSGSNLNFLVYIILLVFFLFSIIPSLWKNLKFSAFRVQKFTMTSFDSDMPTEILEKVIKMHLLGLGIYSLNAKCIDISLTKVTYGFLFCRKEFFNLF